MSSAVNYVLEPPLSVREKHRIIKFADNINNKFFWTIRGRVFYFNLRQTEHLV